MVLELAEPAALSDDRPKIEIGLGADEVVDGDRHRVAGLLLARMTAAKNVITREQQASQSDAMSSWFASLHFS